MPEEPEKPGKPEIGKVGPQLKAPGRQTLRMSLAQVEFRRQDPG